MGGGVEEVEVWTRSKFQNFRFFSNYLGIQLNQTNPRTQQNPNLNFKFLLKQSLKVYFTLRALSIIRE